MISNQLHHLFTIVAWIAATHLLFTLTPAAAVATDAPTCRYPSGEDASCLGYIPCGSASSFSSCCLRHPNGLRDTCLSNGLCYSELRHYVYQGACGSGAWGDEGCPKYCAVDDDTEYRKLQRCRRNEFCCSKDNKGKQDNCCANEEDVFDMGTPCVVPPPALGDANPSTIATSLSLTDTDTQAGNCTPWPLSQIFASDPDPDDFFSPSPPLSSDVEDTNLSDSNRDVSDGDSDESGTKDKGDEEGGKALAMRIAFSVVMGASCVTLVGSLTFLLVRRRRRGKVMGCWAWGRHSNGGGRLNAVGGLNVYKSTRYDNGYRSSHGYNATSDDMTCKGTDAITTIKSDTMTTTNNDAYATAKPDSPILLQPVPTEQDHNNGNNEEEETEERGVIATAIHHLKELGLMIVMGLVAVVFFICILPFQLCRREKKVVGARPETGAQDIQGRPMRTGGGYDWGEIGAAGGWSGPRCVPLIPNRDTETYKKVLTDRAQMGAWDEGTGSMKRGERDAAGRDEDISMSWPEPVVMRRDR